MFCCVCNHNSVCYFIVCVLVFAELKSTQSIDIKNLNKTNCALYIAEGLCQKLYAVFNLFLFTLKLNDLVLQFKGVVEL